MANLIVQQIVRTGGPVTFGACSVGGDSLPNTGYEFVLVKNADASNKTVTIAVQRMVDGIAVTSRTVVVEAGNIEPIGPFPTGDYNDGADKVQFTYSAVTNLSIAALRLTPEP